MASPSLNHPLFMKQPNINDSSSSCSGNRMTVNLIIQMNDEAVSKMYNRNLNGAMIVFKETAQLLKHMEAGWDVDRNNSNSNSSNNTYTNTNFDITSPFSSLSFPSYRTLHLHSSKNQDESSGAYKMYNKVFIVSGMQQRGLLSCMVHGAVVYFNCALCCHKLGLETGQTKHLWIAVNLYFKALILLEKNCSNKDGFQPQEHQQQQQQQQRNWNTKTSFNHPETIIACTIRSALCHNLSCIYSSFYVYKEAKLMQQCVVHSWYSMRECPIGINHDDIEFFKESLVLATVVDSLQLAPAA